MATVGKIIEFFGGTLKQRHQVLFLLALLSEITYLDRVCISMAGPRIQHALALTPTQWGWLGTAYAVSYALFEIPAGYKGDRIGARAVLRGIVLWWSGFTALTGAGVELCIAPGCQIPVRGGRGGSISEHVREPVSLVSAN